jgi:hypothetical protein
MKSSSLFPATHDYHDQTHQIATGGNVLFDRTALPLSDDFHLRPIVVQPKPDLHFGYSAMSFTNSEFNVMQQPRLSPYAHPNTANYWPFLPSNSNHHRAVVRLGLLRIKRSIRSHYVNSITTLLEHGGQNDLPKRDIQSLAFHVFLITNMHLYGFIGENGREMGVS